MRDRLQKEKSTFSYIAEDGSLKTRMQMRVANAGGAEKHPVTKEDLKIFAGAVARCFIPVSYTHLTLPTILLV